MLARLELLRHQCGGKGALSRALALESCGSCAVLVSPGTGALLLGTVSGRPATARRSCNHRLCGDCQRRRSLQLADDLTVQISALATATEILARGRRRAVLSLSPSTMRFREVSAATDGEGRVVDVVVDAVAPCWDGALRMATLTRHDPVGGDVSEEAGALWEAWRRLRRQWPRELGTSVATLELTYNVERDSVHPHLHVIFLCNGDVNRTMMLGDWQRINGYAVDYGQRPGSQGGVHLKRQRSVKEAIKYPLKGMAGVLASMPAARAIEVLDYLSGRRLVRAGGGLYRRADEPDGVDVDVELLCDATTGEVYAPTSSVAASLPSLVHRAVAAATDGAGRVVTVVVGVVAPYPVATLSWSPVAIEGARERLYRDWQRERSAVEVAAGIARGALISAQRRRRRQEARWRAACARRARALAADAAALRAPPGREAWADWVASCQWAPCMRSLGRAPAHVGASLAFPPCHAATSTHASHAGERDWRSLHATGDPVFAGRNRATVSIYVGA